MITVKHIDTIDGIKDLIFEQTYNPEIIDGRLAIRLYLPSRTAVVLK